MRYALGIVCVASCAVSAFASSTPTAIVQNTGFGANSFINGMQFEGFDRPNKSGDGSRWVFLADNTGESATDKMVIVGAGTGYVLGAQEGVTEIEPGRFFSTFDRYLDVNASGDWVGIGNLSGGATDDDEVVYLGDSSGSASVSVPFREGQAVGAGFTLGSGNHGPSITDAGAISFGWSVTSQGSSEIEYFTNDGLNNPIGFGSTPAGQRGGTSFSLNTPFSGRNAFQVTSDGSSYLVGGELLNGDEVFIVDGRVVLQEGDSLAGGVVANILGEENLLQDNGDWHARVQLDNGAGAAIKNGSVLATDGDLVGGSVAGEQWDGSAWTSSNGSTFAIVAGDSNGNTVLGGFTDNPDQSRNFVWTYNGAEFLRAGAQIDLDGDGSLDDAFIAINDRSSASIEPIGGFLADDGFFYTSVDVNNGAGVEIGEAFIRVFVPSPGALGVFGLAGLAAVRRRR